MQAETKEMIGGLEQRLRTAMLEGDVAALDPLLAEDLVFLNHEGQVLTKEQDLEAHRTGALKISHLDYADESTRALGDVAVVTLRAEVRGTYLGEAFAWIFAYTRVWACGTGIWQVVSAHCSARPE